MSKRFQMNLTLVLGVVGVLIWSVAFVRMPKAVAADDPGATPTGSTQLYCCALDCPGDGFIGAPIRDPRGCLYPSPPNKTPCHVSGGCNN
jgi:hypothetical protein